MQLNGNSKPVPPPRDHLRIEKDGRLINCAPAPQLPDRRCLIAAGNGSAAAAQQQQQQIAQIVEPTLEQLDSIKKYQVSGSDLCTYVFAPSLQFEFPIAPGGRQHFSVPVSASDCTTVVTVQL